MAKAKDITGLKFNRLTVLNREPNKGTHAMWKCQCDCGNITVLPATKLFTEKTKSCGCYGREISSKLKKKHGGYGTRLYRIWIDMKNRCNNPNDKDYPKYGARGITVCDEWKNDFPAFCNWAYDNGYDESLTVDRIDNDGNYEPSNCRWSTAKTQANNRRSNHLIEFNGETHSIAEWGEITGLGKRVIRDRIKDGWTIKDALTTSKIVQKGVHHGRL